MIHYFCSCLVENIVFYIELFDHDYLNNICCDILLFDHDSLYSKIFVCLVIDLDYLNIFFFFYLDFQYNIVFVFSLRMIYDVVVNYPSYFFCERDFSMK